MYNVKGCHGEGSMKAIGTTSNDRDGGEEECVHATRHMYRGWSAKHINCNHTTLILAIAMPCVSIHVATFDQYFIVFVHNFNVVNPFFSRPLRMTQKSKHPHNLYWT